MNLQVPVVKETLEWHLANGQATQGAIGVLSGQIEDGWTLIQPLTVVMEQDEDGSYIMSDDVFLVYGYGDTSTAAYEDYISSLIEFYELVAYRAIEGEPVVLEQFAYYQEYLRHDPT